MARQALVILCTVLAFGILVPWYKGFTFLNPVIILAYGCLALLFAAPASAEHFAGNSSDESPSAILGKMALVISYGWGVTVVILVTALITINLTYWHGALITPPFTLCSAVLLLSLTASAAVAACGALLARRLSATGVKSILRLGFLVLLLAFAFSSRLPDQWQIFLSEHATRRAITRLAWEGSAISALVAAVLLIPLLKRPAGNAV
jgi:hypothetical protein